MTVKELRDLLNSLIESGRDYEEVMIKYFDPEYGVYRCEPIKEIGCEEIHYPNERVITTLIGNEDPV